MSFIIIFILIVVAIIVIFAITAAMNRPSQWPQQPQQPQQPWPQVPPAGGMQGTPLHIEPAADGFWIHPVGYPVGAVIHYRYHIYGAPQQSTALVETGGRQFIYTGDPPTDIIVTHITPPSGVTDSPTVWPYPQQGTGGTTSSSDYPTTRPAPREEDTSVSGGDFGGGEGPSQAADETSSTPAGGYPSAY